MTRAVALGGWGLAVLALLALAWPVCAQKPASSLAGQTVAGEARGSAPAAEEEAALRRALAAQPESAELAYRLALVLREENKPRESLEAYTHAAELRKPDAGELRSVALDYVLLGDYADAIRWLERAAAMEPRNVEVLYSLGRCYFTESRFHDAEAMFLRVLAVEPEHVKAEENLGLTYDAESQPEKAEAALRKAVDWAEKPSSSIPDEWPFLDLGSFLLDRDRAGEATPYLKRAAEIRPESAVCHEKLGRALEESGRIAEGVRELETAVRLDAGNPNVHFELGHAYRRAGDDAKARAEFAESARLRKLRDGK